MPEKVHVDKLSIYVPKNKMPLDLVGRLTKIGTKVDRSINYLIIEAIQQFLEKAEQK
jgi:predicted transcriptional regulator